MTSPADSAWANAFNSAPPRPVLSALQRRLQASATHVHALSELFRERAVIEQEYATKLGKLVRSAEGGQLSGKGATEWDRHSAEAKLWDSVLSDIQETASAHSTLSATLKSDFEQPIRDMPNKITPWRQIHDQESSLDRTLKDAEKTASKLDKASMKKSTKADQLSSDLNQMNSTLGSLAPRVFTTFQRLDEERLRSLKEVIVRWTTARADLATKDGQRAEASLSKLLSWEADDEVTVVGNRIASASGGRAGSVSGQGTSVPGVNSTPTRNTAAQGADVSSDLTPRSMIKANGSNTHLPVQAHTGGGGFSGFKSMLTRKATVSGRQRSGSEATSMRSARRTTTDDVFSPLDERDEAEAARRPSIPRQQSDRRPEVHPPVSAKPVVDEEGYTIAPADRHRSPWDEPNEDIPTSAPTGVALPSAIFAAQGTSAVQGTASPDTSRPSSAAGSFDTGGGGPQRLNLALSSAPIKESPEERSAALAKMQQTLQAVPAAPARRGTIARGRREVRNTMQAESAAMQPHLAALANTETNTGENGEREQLTDLPQSGASSVMQTAARRMSVSSTTSSRNPFDPAPTVPNVPPKASFSAGSTAVGGLVGAAAGGAASLVSRDTGSDFAVARLNSPPPIASQLTSPSSTATVPGLQATMVETVHAFIRQFTSQRTAVTGEIHLSFVPTDLRPVPGPNSPLHIRLTGFDSLESIAPNPTFLSQVPEQPGEYFLNLDLLAQATATGSGSTGPALFKYHVLVPEEAGTAILPLTLNPAFQARDGETRMILHYRAGAVPTTRVGLTVTFPDEPVVTTTQSKPLSCSWAAPADSSAGRLASWDASNLQAGADAKIVARFVTGPGASPLVPTAVHARFIVPNHLVSGLGIEIVDSDPALAGWAFDDVSRSTVSGKYVGDVTLNP